MFGRATLVCLALSLAATPAQAQNLRVGGDVAFVLPIGNWADVSQVGFGAMAKAELLVMSSLAVTGRLGYIYHLERDVLGLPYTTAELPILLGAKYYLMADAGGLYGAVELGMINLSATSSFLGNTITVSEMKLGATVGAGFDFDGIDVRAQLFLPSLKDADDFLGIMATVGYAVTVF